VQLEVRTTICEMQVRLAMMARENERLQTALLEQLEQSELCLRSLFWPLSPSTAGFVSRFMQRLWCFCHRIFKVFVWFFDFADPLRDHRRSGLHASMEALRDAVSELRDSELLENSTTSGEGGAASDLLEMPPSLRRTLLMAMVAAATAMPQNMQSSWEEPLRAQPGQPALLPEESSAASPVVDEADATEPQGQAALEYNQETGSSASGPVHAGGRSDTGEVEDALDDNHESVVDRPADGRILRESFLETAEVPEELSQESEHPRENAQCKGEREVNKDEDGDNDSILHLSEPPSAEEFEDANLGGDWEDTGEAPAESLSNQENTEEHVDEQPRDEGHRSLDEQEAAVDQPVDMLQQPLQVQHEVDVQQDPSQRECCDSWRAKISLLQALRTCRCERRKQD